MGDKELTNALARMVDANRKRDEQMEEDQRRRDLRMEELAEANRVRDDKLTQQSEQLAKILQSLVPAAGAGAAAVAATPPTVVTGALPSFQQFDVTSEMWPDYWCGFKTFFEANSVPEGKQPHVFLTNQSTVVYKMLANLSAQQTPPKQINSLTMKEIEDFMADQFNPKKFVVRERYKFWSKMDRKPGETVPELAARLRADAATCDFASIKDPQDEALRTRFFCSVNNEAVLKAFFRVKDDELSFAKAVEIAQELEDASAVAKDTIYGNAKSSPVFRVGWEEEEPAAVNRTRIVKDQPQKGRQQQKQCDRCGRTDHSRDNCRMMDATCFHCQRKGHISAMCRARQRESPPQPPPIRDQHTVRLIRTVNEVPPVGRVGQIRRVSSSEESASSADEYDRRTPPSVTVGRNEPSPPTSRDTVGRRRRQPSTPSSTRNATCYRCRTKGHIAARCRSEQKGGSPPMPPPINGQHDEFVRKPAMEQPQDERSLPRKSDRREVETQTTHVDRSVMEIPTTRRGDRLANGQPYGATTTRAVYEETPATESEDERRESISEEGSVGSGSSTSANERELSRKEAKRRRRSRYRQRRRAKKEVPKLQSSDPRHLIKERHLRTQPIPLRDDSPIGQAAASGVRSRSTSIGGRRGRRMPPQVTFQSRRGARQTESRSHPPRRTDRDDRDFVGEESSDAEKSSGRQPPIAAADDVDPRRRGEHAATDRKRIGVVGSAIAAGYRQYDREDESADVGKKSVSQDEGDRSSPAQMQERQPCDRGTDEGNGNYKGKFTFPSVHHAVRQPPDRISSVSTFRVAHRDDAVPPQTEEVLSPPHVSPSGDDSERMSPWQIEWNAAEHRHHRDQRNWFNWDTAEEAILVGSARQRHRREMESADPPDISTLFG